MTYQLDENLLDHFVNDFAEGKLTKAELQAFSELQEMDPSVKKAARSGMRARQNLQKLPFTGCRPGFSERMSKRFANELEHERKRSKDHVSSSVT
ncbi:MAG: hypothetical protein GVY08_12560 [Bacteroidetes bacterium]|jgi:hypothetical protein|nr:hypothetical protein [Bacteroidota bacterium]